MLKNEQKIVCLPTLMSQEKHQNVILTCRVLIITVCINVLILSRFVDFLKTLLYEILEELMRFNKERLNVSFRMLKFEIVKLCQTLVKELKHVTWKITLNQNMPCQKYAWLSHLLYLMLRANFLEYFGQLFVSEFGESLRRSSMSCRFSYRSRTRAYIVGFESLHRFCLLITMNSSSIRLYV